MRFRSLINDRSLNIRDRSPRPKAVNPSDVFLPDDLYVPGAGLGALLLTLDFFGSGALVPHCTRAFSRSESLRGHLEESIAPRKDEETGPRKLTAKLHALPSKRPSWRAYSTPPNQAHERRAASLSTPDPFALRDTYIPAASYLACCSGSRTYKPAVAATATMRSSLLRGVRACLK